MRIVSGTASLISLLVLSPRRTWRHVLHVHGKRANTLPDHAPILTSDRSKLPERITNGLASRDNAIGRVYLASETGRLADHRILSEAAPPPLGRDASR